MNDLQKVEKYLNFLRDIKAKLDTTSKISMSDYIAKHNISKRTTQALQEGGILTKSGGTKHANWYWSSPVIPNIKMADELITRCTKINFEYQKSHRARKAAKPIVEEIVAHIETDKEYAERVAEIENKIVIEESVSHDYKFRPVQYHEPTKYAFAAHPEPKTNRRVKKPKVKFEREKLFSVLWGIIKIKW
jgi:hypothetical protein